jgi:two-component system, LuxR family, response regulator FixJ
MQTTPKQPCIFFVDDEAGIRKIVRLTLEEELSCCVTCFGNAKECLDALADEQRRCDLLITDIKMPGMDGMTLLAKVRPLRPILPILVVTGHGDVPMAIKALKAGAMDFIGKPLDEHILLLAVKIALSKSMNADHWIGKPLTGSETQILQLVAEGNSNSEMAHLLNRSIRTIERHRYQLMKKLGVGSAAELTKVALALGLTSLDISK